VKNWSGTTTLTVTISAPVAAACSTAYLSAPMLASEPSTATRCFTGEGSTGTPIWIAATTTRNLTERNPQPSRSRRKYLTPHRVAPDVPPSRRRLLRLGSVALAGPPAGCISGALDAERSVPDDSTDASTTTSDPTTHALAEESAPSDSSAREASVEFPAGPKSLPERPADLTAESVREYVRSFERRWVYNRLYRGESTEVHRECGVDSVEEYGEGFRVVVWCSAWADFGEGETTVHADYFTQYATYLVGPDATVRRDGESKTRR
jgi:hypothetical protein